MKWALLVIGLFCISFAGFDLYRGESQIKIRTVTAKDDGQEFYGFIFIKSLAGVFFLYGFKSMHTSQDTWY